ncbi:casein kinase I [Drosophila tropicalis]|uniref:casein kinase I n=1 Tax=Drosophila tropicalis TaxID=46794 RepID=UPI0035ABC13D
MSKSQTSKGRQSTTGLENQLVGGKFRLIKAIGSGSFGEIYKGVNIKDASEVAVKIEPSNAKYPQLIFEAKVYEQLGRGPGFPTLLHYCTETNFNAMVIELLGPSLEELFNMCKRQFSLKTVLMLADQLLMRLECVHQQGFIHRDIKPDNFLMGLGRHVNKLYLIDFGLAKRFEDPERHQHIPYRKDRNLTGTVRYASINAQMGVEQSRRDDLESLSYCILYFHLGKLPWQGITASNKKQKYERILEKKNSVSIEALCKSLPSEFALFMKYARNLRFKEDPDYVYLRQLFRILFRTLSYQFDYIYDWTILQKQQDQQDRLQREGQLEKQRLEHQQQKPRIRHTQVHRSERNPQQSQQSQHSNQQQSQHQISQQQSRRSMVKYERVGDGQLIKRL